MDGDFRPPDPNLIPDTARIDEVGKDILEDQRRASAEAEEARRRREAAYIKYQMVRRESALGESEVRSGWWRPLLGWGLAGAAVGAVLAIATPRSGSERSSG